ncbi:BMP family lipoprotein [Deinococcus planocerae]|uniref:BMP family lipoprotein n=1 Tax=Deinococcus planocerae TaxID=1737569 RepID=UPI000C7F7191|nr:BMP family ABC transporter substrate-binding protein [Deinococcus planocerae]
MKRLLTLTLAVTTALAASPLTLAQDTVRVGMAFHAGGKFDGSFNQAAYEGGQRAARTLGVQVKDFEAGDPSQVVGGIRAFAREGFDLTVGLGTVSNASVTQVARENPELHFGLVDDVSPAPNVASLTFADEQGSYLVGYLAGLNTSTGVVGFVGGMDVPAVHRFEAGYTAGVRAAYPGARVVTQYLGTTPDAWTNPGKAKEVAASLRARGADILFTAAGASGNGVIDYVRQTQCLRAADLPAGARFKSNNFARVPKSAAYQRACADDTRPLFFIGVDRNQNPQGDFDRNPATLNHGLTSMMKRADNAVYALIREVRDGEFKGGVRRLGLREGGVGYAVDRYNRALISPAQVLRIEAVKAGIIAGRIKVPTR